MAFRLDRFRPTGASDPLVHGDNLSRFLLGFAGLAVAIILYLLIDGYLARRREQRLLKRIRQNAERKDTDHNASG